MIVKTEIIDQPEFFVAGIAARTTNQNGASQKDIGDLWARFLQNGAVRQIPDRASDDIYCLYTSYETDHTGYYTTVIGCKVNSLASIAVEFTGITVPASKYQRYDLEGKFPQKVQEAWEQIWHSNIDRKYSADYDLYSANAEGFEKTEVKIYVAVK